MDLKIFSDYQRLKAQAPELVRKFRGHLSYRKAAERLNCSQSYLWNIEHGNDTINDALLEKLLTLMEET